MNISKLGETVSQNTKLNQIGLITIWYACLDSEKVVGKQIAGSEYEIITLKDCYDMAVKLGYDEKCGVIYVIDNGMLDGTIYCYGNHANYWEKVGVTIGFA